MLFYNSFEIQFYYRIYIRTISKELSDYQEIFRYFHIIYCFTKNDHKDKKLYNRESYITFSANEIPCSKSLWLRRFSQSNASTFLFS